VAVKAIIIPSLQLSRTTFEEITMSKIIVNGTTYLEHDLCISAFDRGFTLGDGVFETILVFDGRIPFFSYHWKRLAESTLWLGIPLPFDKHSLLKMMNQLTLDNQCMTGQGGLRLTVTRGVSERGLILSGECKPTYVLQCFRLPAKAVESMSASIVNTRRNEHSLSSRIKSISYLDNVLAKQEAAQKGFDEAFLLNSQGSLAEGATTNVFIVLNGCIITPRVEDGALPGVMRSVILHRALEKGIEIQTRTITPEMLYAAEEIFITNALRGVVPIHQLDDKMFLKPFKIADVFQLPH
jgi:branched-chain amino acid aminotransferase